MDNVEKFVNEVFALAETDEIAKSANEKFEQFKGSQNRAIVELKEADITKVLKMSYISERFFGRKRAWIINKINHNIKNGKPDDFTAEQRETLKNALETIAFELQELADNM